MKNLRFLFLLLIATTLFSCRPKTNPNEWVLSTTTCWNTMTVSKAGDVYPKLFGTCDRGIILPATFLAAEFSTDTKFGTAQGSRLSANVQLAYQWRISDPQIFVSTAKSLVSSSSNEHEKVDPDVLEGVENAVVDKMVINLIREYTPTVNLRDIDELAMEKDLQVIFTRELASRGVETENLSLNIDLSGQAEEALDVISALEIYKMYGEEDLGRKIIEAKAGATNVTVQSGQ